MKKIQIRKYSHFSLLLSSLVSCFPLCYSAQLSFSNQVQKNRQSTLHHYKQPPINHMSSQQMGKTLPKGTTPLLYQQLKKAYEQMKQERDALLQLNKELADSNEKLHAFNTHLLTELKRVYQPTVQNADNMPSVSDMDESKNGELSDEEQALHNSHAKKLKSYVPLKSNVPKKGQHHLLPRNSVSSSVQNELDPNYFKELYHKEKERNDDLMEKYTKVIHENNQLYTYAKGLNNQTTLKNTFIQHSEEIKSWSIWDIISSPHPQSKLPYLHHSSIHKKQKNAIASVRIPFPENFKEEYQKFFTFALCKYKNSKFSKTMPLPFLNGQVVQGNNLTKKLHYKGVVHLIQGIFNFGRQENSFAEERDGIMMQVVQYYNSSFVMIYCRDQKENSAMNWSYQCILHLDTFKSPLIQKLFKISFTQLQTVEALKMHLPLPENKIIRIKLGLPLFDQDNKKIIDKIDECQYFPYICVKKLQINFFFVEKKLDNGQWKYNAYRASYQPLGSYYHTTGKIRKRVRIQDEVMFSTGLMSMMYPGTGVTNSKNIGKMKLVGWKIEESNGWRTLTPLSSASH